MANVCEKYKVWTKEQYWSGKLADKFYFYKIMLGDFGSCLRFPRKFKKNFDGTLLDKADIRGPDGDTWTTELLETDQDLVIQNGWETFAKDHSLKQGDFLLFEYSGYSCFSVLIFDGTGSERKIAHTVIRDRDLNESFDDDEESEVHGTEDHPVEVKSDLDDLIEDNTYVFPVEVVDEMEEDQEEESACNTASRQQLFRRGKTSASLHKGYFRKKAVQLAADHCSSLVNPNFFVSMSPPYLNVGMLHLPTMFIEEHKGERELQSVDLFVKNKSWTVKVYSYRGGKRQKFTYYKLGQGFGKFADENKLKVGDTCVFESLTTPCKDFNITIFRCSNEVDVHQSDCRISQACCYVSARPCLVRRMDC